MASNYGSTGVPPEGDTIHSYQSHDKILDHEITTTQEESQEETDSEEEDFILYLEPNEFVDLDSGPTLNKSQPSTAKQIGRKVCDFTKDWASTLYDALNEVWKKLKRSVNSIKWSWTQRDAYHSLNTTE